MVAIILVCTTCNSEKEDSLEELFQRSEAGSDIDGTVARSKTTVVNECLQSTYHARLLETHGVDSNAFTLEIDFYDQVKSSKRMLDLPSGRSKIMDCNEDFVIIGFACGGPCYADVFISLEGDKPDKTYGYSNRMLLDSHILAYIEGEEFDKQIIRNLESEAEIIVDISKCVDAWNSPCLIDTMYFTNKNTLLLDYKSPREEKITYHVEVEDLLKI